jgi:hypothetical protein
MSPGNRVGGRGGQISVSLRLRCSKAFSGQNEGKDLFRVHASVCRHGQQTQPEGCTLNKLPYGYRGSFSV